MVTDSGAFNVNRLKEQIPTVQFYSSNPRNSSIKIRGLGAPFGLTNDGIEPGVGMYIDGAYYARPASATLDFLDVEQIEVLRGPQGTLFGKNTTAGAINVTTRKPSFSPESDIELNYGSLGLVQAKASLAGPLLKTVAGRLSFSGTTRQRHDLHTDLRRELNGLNNLGLRGQVLYTPSAKLAISLAADNTRQRPIGYAQVVAGVAPTLRPANRQYEQIAADLGYTAPSFNAYDRVTDTDTAWQSNQDLGGASLTIDRSFGRGTIDGHHGVALLGLGSVERPRLHRTSRDDGVGKSVEAASVDPGNPLCRRHQSRGQRRVRRVWFPSGDHLDAANRNRDKPRRVFCLRQVQRRQRRDCSMDTGNRPTSDPAMSAPRCSGRQNGR